MKKVITVLLDKQPIMEAFDQMAEERGWVIETMDSISPDYLPNLADVGILCLQCNFATSTTLLRDLHEVVPNTVAVVAINQELFDRNGDCIVVMPKHFSSRPLSRTLDHD